VTGLPWHARAAADLPAALETGPSGLSDAETARRLQEYGPNRLTPPEPDSAVPILHDQLEGIVVILQVAAAVVSLRMGDPVEAIAIAAVLVINSLIGFTAELRARRLHVVAVQERQRGTPRTAAGLPWRGA
jgi:P-type Ca2+ transporter type 2C